MPSIEKIKVSRVEFIDIAKGVAIIAMVLSHTYRGYDLRVVIYAFLMPLFFFISGLFFRPDKYNSFGIFIKNKARTLLLPFICFYAISYVYWFFIERHIRQNSISVNPLNPIIGLIYGTDYKYYMLPNGALWFLTCLFTTETLLFLIIKTIRKDVLIFITVLFIGISGYLISTFDVPKLPLSFNSSLIALFFTYSGYVLKNKISILEKANRLLLIFIGIMLLSIMYFISLKNGMINMDYCKYFNPYMFMLAAFLGIFGILAICKTLNTNFLLQYFGINSIIILGLSEPIKRIIIAVLSKIGSIPIDQIRLSIIYSIAVVSITLIILVPIIYIFNTYLYAFIGKKKPIALVNN